VSDFEVRGADQFLRLSKALKDAGRTELRKELTKGMRVAAKPLVAKTRAAARTQLPQRGGLADQVAREPQRIQVRTGRDPGVRVVVARRRGGARSTNVGVVRHPVFADGSKTRSKWTWTNQNVRPGWFDDTLRAESPAIRRDLERALETVADNIVREAKRG
jgi:hypothetical protein